ncbi:MAG: dTDP-4-dehydrorhamnose reductase [Parvularculaceae bacterium]|nr:dTDP-4-dehydrorhamnose reductase [Parvularculaceae bacterium]
MRIAIFGANGQVGRELAAVAGRSTGIDVELADRARADLGDADAAASFIRAARPDAVINAAAWTAVDKAETEKSAAYRVNADAVHEIAQACTKTGARLVHISTDYVFAGDGAAPLTEDAPTRPLGVYGASKLKGEEAALSALPDACILRTSWVYSPHGSNFVKTMIRLAHQRDEIAVVADQIGGPTPASAIAEACFAIAAKADGPGGIFHFQGAPAASWADFAEAIFAAAGLKTKVRKIPTAEFPTPAKRPLFTVLDCEKIHNAYGIVQPDWRRDLQITAPRLLEAYRKEAAGQ